jgi:uncharacterized protein
MAIDQTRFDRRQFLALAASAAVASPFAARAQAATGAHYVASCREGVDTFSAVAFNPEGQISTRVALPARGHDIAMRPGSSECVVFARRPGTFAVAFDATGAKPSQPFMSRPDRHFFGHGVFSPDGRLLYATENDFAGERGMISVRDATGGYLQIGEFPSGGIGPHDIALLSDGITLVVANGGIDTNPDSGRAPLNLDSMQPSLAYIDVRTGELIEQQMLEASLHQLSIRHLAVARGDVVTFGCQQEGAGQPALVGWHRRGSKPALFEAPDVTYSAMKNYVGSVSVDASGSIVSATSPRGGRVLFFDIASRKLIGDAAIKDVCGVAPSHQGEGFLLTTGMGDVTFRNPATENSSPVSRHLDGIAFDNHAVSF